MKSLISFAVATLLGLCSINAAELILDPPKSAADGKPIAIIWIHGMQCQPEAYKTIAVELQNVAAQNGYKAWVGAPEFTFDVPNPVEIDSYVSSTLATLK